VSRGGSAVIKRKGDCLVSASGWLKKCGTPRVGKKRGVGGWRHNCSLLLGEVAKSYSRKDSLRRNKASRKRYGSRFITWGVTKEKGFGVSHSPEQSAKNKRIMKKNCKRGVGVCQRGKNSSTANLKIGLARNGNRRLLGKTQENKKKNQNEKDRFLEGGCGVQKRGTIKSCSTPIKHKFIEEKGGGGTEWGRGKI